MRTRILAGAAVGGGLVLLFSLIFAVSDGLVIRLALFYGLATVGLIGIHRRQVDHTPALAWIGFVPAAAAYLLSLAGIFASFADATLPAIAGRSFGFFAQEAFWVSSAIFGAATLAIGVLPRVAALALMIGSPLAMVGMFLGPSPDPVLSALARAGVIAYGAGLIWLGLSVWTANPRPLTSAA